MPGAVTSLPIPPTLGFKGTSGITAPRQRPGRSGLGSPGMCQDQALAAFHREGAHTGPASQLFCVEHIRQSKHGAPVPQGGHSSQAHSLPESPAVDLGAGLRLLLELSSQPLF